MLARRERVYAFEGDLLKLTVKDSTGASRQSIRGAGRRSSDAPRHAARRAVLRAGSPMSTAPSPMPRRTAPASSSPSRARCASAHADVPPPALARLGLGLLPAAGAAHRRPVSRGSTRGSGRGSRACSRPRASPRTSAGCPHRNAPVRDVLHRGQANPAYRRLCYTAAWGVIAAYPAVNITGLLARSSLGTG